MHPVVENFLERPLSHKVAFTAFGCVGIIVISWFSLLASKKERFDTLTENVARLETSVQSERRLAAKLPQAREKLKDLEVRLQTALEELPDRSEIDDILERVSNLAREAGLELMLFARRDENFKEFYAEVPVNVSVVGAYQQVAMFFDEVGRLPRIVNINNISLIDPKLTDDALVLKIDFTLTAFRYLNESDRQKQTTTADKKKRR
jgi:type IV pilus assembly protein PilO